MQKEIIMGKVRLRFDDNRQTKELDKEVRAVLQPRCETVIKLPTRSKEFETGLIENTEIAPGVALGRTLIVARNRACPASVVNMNEIETEICLPVVSLEPSKLIGAVEAEGHVATVNRLCELKGKVRTDNFNGQEWASLLRIYEEYNDIF
jgi:hypothetical protein